MKCRLLTPLLTLSFSLAAIAQDVPKADLFLGYSYLRFNSAREIPAFSSNGGLGTFGLNFNNHFGLELEAGGYHNGNIHNYHLDNTAASLLLGPRISLGRSKKVDPYFHVLFGGMLGTTSISAVNLLTTTLPNVNRVIVTGPNGTLVTGPNGAVLTGPDGTVVTGPNGTLIKGPNGTVITTANPNFTVTVPKNLRYGADQGNFAMVAGGGLDIKISKVVTFRPIQLDYMLTRFQSLGFLGIPSENRNQNNLRYAAGFMFNIGGEHPTPPPAMKACWNGTSVLATQDCPLRDMTFSLSASPSEICPGGTISVAPPAGLPDGASSHWSVNGEAAGQSAAFQFATANRAPGAYKISLKVTAPGYNDASTDTTVHVLAYQAPTGSLSATPTELWVGEKATLSPNFTAGQCGGPLHPAACSVQQGSINGTQYDSASVQFDPNDSSEQRKNVTIACNVSDDKGSGSAQTDVIVKKKGAIMAKRLPDVLFAKNSARVNNCGKRVLLEDLKTYEDSDPTASVVFVGHQTDNESPVGLDLKRAMNVAAVISAGKGVCTAFPAAQVLVSAVGADQKGVDLQPHFCGTSMGSERPGQGVSESDDAAKYRRVEVWFVPTNGTLPPSLAKEYKNAATLAVVGLGCPQ